jgi:DNA-binding CsgD family transcriptional regulator/tetratricopeptide (TPR) repeat protein
LLERERELTLLHAVLGDAAARMPCLMFLRGEAGIGKSRLARMLEGRAQAAGFTVLRGDCVNLGGAELPYAPLGAALRDVPASALESAWQLVSPQARIEVRRAFPHVKGGEPVDGPALVDRFSQARLFESMLAVLRALSDDEPTLLVIEDFHWVDRSTRDFIEFLARNLRRERLAVVITFRTDELPPQHPVPQLISELVRLPAVGQAALRRLSRAGVAAQLEDILGSGPPSALVAEIQRRSGGNPFLAEELLASWVDNGTTAVPDNLSDALLARYRALSTGGQRLVNFAAVMLSPIDSTILSHATGVTEPKLTRLLHACADQHLLTRMADDGTFTFRHDLVREAVQRHLSPAERKELHHAIALTLTTLGRQRSSAELAFHWRGAGELAAALAASVQAALEAEQAHAFRAALDLFDGARSLWDQLHTAPEGLELDRVDLDLHAVDLARYTGDYKRACRLCVEALDALDSSVDPVRAAEFYERRGRCESYQADAGLASYREAIALMPEDRHADRARLISEEGFALTMARRWDDALDRCRAALALALEAQAPAEEGYARMMLGVALAFAGDPTGGERELRAARHLANASGRAEDLLRSCLYLAEVLRLDGRVRAALEVTTEGEQKARELGMYATFGRYMALNAASDLFFVGAWDEAATRVATVINEDLEPWEALLAEQVAGQIALARGDLDAAQRTLRKAQRLYEDGAPPEYAPDVYAPLAELSLRHGRIEEARAAIRDGLAALADDVDLLHAPVLFVMGARVEASASERTWPPRTAESQAFCAQLDRLLDRGGSGGVPPMAQAYRAWCHAETARTAAQPSEQLWADAAAAWNELGAPYPAAYAHWRQAEAVLAGGHERDKAGHLLRAAREAATSLQAHQLLLGIEELTRSYGLTLERGADRTDAPPDPGAALGLTPRELEVLALIAQGLTNRQIAATLVISEKTAGVHVAHIFAKLDVHNRVAATTAARRAGLLGAEPAGNRTLATRPLSTPRR